MAANCVPAYRDLLKKRGVDSTTIRTFSDFLQKVPVIAKEDIFPKYPLHELFRFGDISIMQSAMTSSGFSGIFSFGVSTMKSLVNAPFAIDLALEYGFNIDKKKTFLINCVPMGVQIPTLLPQASTSVRAEMVLALFQKIKPYFDQVIFVSDPHFLKKLLEDGLEHGISWKQEKVHLISGGDWFSDSFRSYIEGILGSECNGNKMLATMGIAELDLNLFHESPFTIQIRKACAKDQQLNHALFGGDFLAIPLLMHYYPHRLYLETANGPTQGGELVFTMLSETLAIPMIRYNSKDFGVTLSYTALANKLSELGYSHLIPDLKLPLVAIGGRKGNAFPIGREHISPEWARDRLYRSHAFSKIVTGQFLLSGEPSPTIEIQLKKNILKNEALHILAKELFSEFPSLQVKLLEYYEFSQGMGIDYETKFRHTIPKPL